LMTNKNTWFAHFFRGGGVPVGHKSGFPYSISQRQINRARDYSEDLWLNNKWEKQTRSMEWLVEKFDPPSWDHWEPVQFRLNSRMYRHIHRGKNLPKWRCLQILKMPSDLITYSEVISETKPELIVEIGTKYGGSALYFQDMLDLSGGGQVLTVDIEPQVENHDPRIKYLVGSSTDKEIIKEIKRFATDKKTMLVIDGNHHRRQVKWELHHYHKIVSPGCYLVVEDCYIDRGMYGPGEARDWFLERYPGFEQTNRCKKYLTGVCLGGWLRKV